MKLPDTIRPGGAYVRTYDTCINGNHYKLKWLLHQCDHKYTLVYVIHFLLLLTLLEQSTRNSLLQGTETQLRMYVYVCLSAIKGPPQADIGTTVNANGTTHQRVHQWDTLQDETWSPLQMAKKIQKWQHLKRQRLYKLYTYVRTYVRTYITITVVSHWQRSHWTTLSPKMMALWCLPIPMHDSPPSLSW